MRTLPLQPLLYAEFPMLLPRHRRVRREGQGLELVSAAPAEAVFLPHWWDGSTGHLGLKNMDKNIVFFLGCFRLGQNDVWRKKHGTNRGNMLKVWESLWNTETLQLWDVTSCDYPTLCKVTGFKHPQPSCQSSKDNSLRIFLQIQSWVRLLEDHRKNNRFIQRCLNWYCGCAWKLGHTPKFGCFNRDCEWLRWLNSGMGYPIFNLHKKRNGYVECAWYCIGFFNAFLRNGHLP